MRESSCLLVEEWAEDSSEDADKEMAQSKKPDQQHRERRRIDKRMKDNKVDEIQGNRRGNGKEI